MPTSALPSEARQFSCERECSQPQVSVQRADANLGHLAKPALCHEVECQGNAFLAASNTRRYHLLQLSQVFRPGTVERAHLGADAHVCPAERSSAVFLRARMFPTPG